MKRDFAGLTGTHFDLLVCGGGIYGAWTAYDAALRGLKVALVEQGDWASATSSASSKLIHGGLRYLESFDFSLVKKALAERSMLLKTAPHRVWPLRFGIPVYVDSRNSRLKLQAGLTLYDLLACNLSANMKHRYFNVADFPRRFSALSQAGLQGGFTYMDAQTDDSRLVLELVAGAMAAGAVCVNYFKLIALNETNGIVTGATVQDGLGGKVQHVQARQVVNTTGQWLAAAEVSRPWCRLSKGIHLILPAKLGDEALLLTAQSDGRVFFMLPWYGLTLVGTTDADYYGDLDNVKVEHAELDYLLREVNHYLHTQWTENDVLGSYAGVRVMQHSEDATPSAVSRDWALKATGNGVLYSVGGKLTSAREDAAVMVDVVCRALGVAVACQTKCRAFPWAPDNFSVWVEVVTARARSLGIDAESCKWLLRRQGTRVNEILCEVERDPALAQRIYAKLPFIYADLLFCARHEMVVHLEDLIRRRLPLSILTKLDGSELRQIAEVVAETLGWDEARVNQELATINR